MKPVSYSDEASSFKEELCLKLIGFLGAQEGALQKLSLESGLTPGQLYGELMSPFVQGGILDFLLSNEGLLMMFCSEENITPQEIWKLRLQLPGAPA